ncbi:MAG: (2Fe-2S)-binding protein [Dehalococcoidales bacterium]|nr:(2Fe-2S)-binding protein [Dehalococcoidales bacterium]
MKIDVAFNVNGEEYQLSVEPHRTLLEVLRNELDLTGTKEGCSEGECGACTVLVDGIPVNSCLSLAATANGKQITTIEGLVKNGELHPLQQAFIDQGAVQCGYCTPGMLLTAKALLDIDPAPSDVEIKRAIAGNVCRCTGYVKIIEAIKVAGQQIANGGKA